MNTVFLNIILFILFIEKALAISIKNLNDPHWAHKPEVKNHYFGLIIVLKDCDLYLFE